MTKTDEENEKSSDSAVKACLWGIYLGLGIAISSVLETHQTISNFFEYLSLIPGIAGGFYFFGSYFDKKNKKSSDKEDSEDLFALLFLSGLIGFYMYFSWIGWCLGWAIAQKYPQSVFAKVHKKNLINRKPKEEPNAQDQLKFETTESFVGRIIGSENPKSPR